MKPTTLLSALAVFAAVCAAGENADASTEEILAHYKTLTPEDQGKDWLPYNSMLKLLRRYEGLRIYHLNKD